MCGIAGLVRWDAAAGHRQDAESVERMVAALRHRGPDGDGLVVCRAGGTAPQAVLGHTRLSIIDLSDRAAQPMESRARPLWLTYNGEIYNFAGLRRELEAHGRTFHSQSDTEVILQGYEQWGADVVAKLHGMFAFGLWDGERGELLLARDRLGIKPLYVHEGDGVLVFASEIRSLLASGLVPRRLDAESLASYLRHQTVPTPRTLVRAVRMLRPGHTARARATGLVERGYWDLLGSRVVVARHTTGEEARDRVRQLLRESIARHLVSDVPVGAFLSGGIDSGALVALLADAGRTAETYTVTFDGAPGDEAAAARAVAGAFGMTHTEIPLTEARLLEALPAALNCVDHPSGDGVNTGVIAEAVRRAGVKVALSGLGGDELFGGYPSFNRLARVASRQALWQKTPSRLRRAAASAVRAAGRGSVASLKAAAVIESDGSMAVVFPVLREMFGEADRRALLGTLAEGGEADPYELLLREAASRAGEADVMTLVSFAEARTYMHDVLLRDTDQMSMAHGLEIRVPLLDHALAEYVLGLPASLKTGPHGPKHLLVESLPRPLPPVVTARPKQGFVLPLDAWMRGALRPFCEQHLGPSGLGGRGLLDPEAVAGVWQAFLDGSARTSWSRSWTLVALDAWLEQTGVSV